MFDYVVIQQELGFDTPQNHRGVVEGQTKTLDCLMSTYRIHDDQLFLVERKLRRTGKKLPDSIFGERDEVIQIDEREKPINFHGVLDVTLDTEKGNNSQVKFKFTDGILTEVVDEGPWRPRSQSEPREPDPEEWWTS